MRRFLDWVLTIIFVGVLSVVDQSASAQASPIEFPVNNFRPGASAPGYFVTENGRLLEHLSPSVQLLANYASRPLRLVDSETNDAEADIIRSRINLDLMVAMGFFDYLELGVVFPATVNQSGEQLSRLDRDPDTTLSGGFGDIRIIPKVRFVTSENKVVSFGLALPFSVPSGNREYFLGDRSLTFSPTAILSFETRWIDIGWNAGFRIRKDQGVAFSSSQDNIAIGHEVFSSLATKIHVWQERLDVVGDGWFSTSIEEQDAEEIPVEVLGGLRAYFGYGLFANAGAGAGLTRGIGAPAYRVMLGFGWEYVEDPDPDQDGILYDADKCQLDPEDKDGFEDVDGCPDKDNDKDGILDIDDRCPVQPEDHDTYQDQDGCPDPDNDQDQIVDTDDKCPLRAEDRDQFEDTDGCPEPDNDQDQILDVDDKCPLDPEDKDGFEDGDGCPDPDNDKDSILDAQDQCPMEPEVVNGFKDEDGCPDEKKEGPVKIEHGKITAPPVFFASGKDVILEQSFPTLNMVAQTFKENPWVKKVRIEGHTDNRGRDAFNLDLSDRRAKSVMHFLIEAGVESSRMDAIGYGETRPIVSNRTSSGRAKNRRVEFVITDPPLTKEETSADSQK